MKYSLLEIKAVGTALNLSDAENKQELIQLCNDRIKELKRKTIKTSVYNFFLSYQREIKDIMRLKREISAWK